MKNTLPRGKCSKYGINPKAVYDFLVGAEKDGLGIDSFMLIKDGVVVSEGYYNPYSPDYPHVLYSMSKSITSTALGFAIDEGKISLDDSISKFFPEYDKLGLNKYVTVRHLVTMTAGKLVNMATNRTHKDWIKIFFNAPFVSKPGKSFFYVNDNFYMLSAIIGKVYDTTLVDFLYPRLFEPLGIEKPFWESDDFGYAAGGWGLYMKTEDSAKIMLCYANGGKYNDKQIIPKDWVEESTKFQVESVKRGQIDVTKGYGYGIWQTSLPDTYRAYGLHGQMGYVFKEHNTVLIVNAGISKDELMCIAINELYKHLWSEPDKSYDKKLAEFCACLGDKDDLPEAERNYDLEYKYDCKTLKTRSSSFASMIHATMTAVMNEDVGRIDRFSLSHDKDNNLYLLWKEGVFVNNIKLGMNGKYEISDVDIAGFTYHAATKAAWTKETVLTVYIRLIEGCHVRKLVFDFTNEDLIVIKNDTYPDMPTLAVHYLDFSGFPLPKHLERFLMKHVAPGVLLIGEPNFRIR